METTFQNINNNNLYSKPLLWAVFGLYIVIAAYTMFHHELWGDELSSWNIAKVNNSFFDLMSSKRYEGHAPVWPILLWSVSKFTHNLIYVQVVHLIIAVVIVFIVLFYAPFSTTNKILLPFGYYFLFEYAIISRDYAIGVLCAFLICIIIKKEFKHKLILYYALLFMMSNTNLLAMILAGSLHLYFLIGNAEQKKKQSDIALHILLGALVFLPAIFFISPPADDQYNLNYFVNNWRINRLAEDLQAPLRAFLPIPAWWQYNFWNMQFLLSLHNKYHALKVISPLLSFAFVGLGCYILKENKKSLILFIANVAITFIVGNLYSLATQRYSGFIFIGFIAAYWLYCYDKPASKNKNRIINILLIIQLAAGMFITYKDIRLPFSNAYRVKELINEVPANEKTVTDYLALDMISAYTDKPFYCLLAQKELLFFSIGKDIGIQQDSNLYCIPLNNFFQKEKIKTVYMISTRSPKELAIVDSKLYSSFHIQLMNKIEGAIEKNGNLYLYQINTL